MITVVCKLHADGFSLQRRCLYQSKVSEYFLLISLSADSKPQASAGCGRSPSFGVLTEHLCAAAFKVLSLAEDTFHKMPL